MNQPAPGETMARIYGSKTLVLLIAAGAVVGAWQGGAPLGMLPLVAAVGVLLGMGWRYVNLRSAERVQRRVGRVTKDDV